MSIEKLGEEYFANPLFREVYEYGLDLWSDILVPEKVDGSDTLLAGAFAVKDDISDIFGFTEGDAEIIMQRTLRDVAEAKGLIGGK